MGEPLRHTNDVLRALAEQVSGAPEADEITVSRESNMIEVRLGGPRAARRWAAHLSLPEPAFCRTNDLGQPITESSGFFRGWHLTITAVADGGQS